MCSRAFEASLFFTACLKIYDSTTRIEFYVTYDVFSQLLESYTFKYQTS